VEARKHVVLLPVLLIALFLVCQGKSHTQAQVQETQKKPAPEADRLKERSTPKPPFCMSSESDFILGKDDIFTSLFKDGLALSREDVALLSFGLDPARLRAAKDKQLAVAERYDEIRKRFLEMRERLRKLPRDEALAEVERMLPYALAGIAFPPWLGTKWGFYGATDTPAHGEIACGYFIAATLYAVGFDVRISTIRENERHFYLAGLAAANVVEKVADPDSIRRFSNRPLSELEAEVRRQGEGVFVLGLDNHVAYIVYQKGTGVWLWHSKPMHAVALERPEEARFVTQSHLRVLGKLGRNSAEAWLDGKRISR